MKEQFEKILFVVWNFPQPTETFIHRELEAMAASGLEVNVLANRRVPRSDITPELERIADNALYINGPQSAPAGMSWAARHPRRLLAASRWVKNLPHRSQRHRLRMLGMLSVAASLVTRVKARQIEYIHAHFAAYQTELAMCLAQLTDIPYGFTAHAYGIWRDRNLIGEKIAGARTIFSCTDHNVTELQRLAPDHRKRVHLVHHGIPLDRVSLQTPPPLDTPIHWLAIGRLVRKKGFSILLDALAQRIQRGANDQLTILGEGPCRSELEAQVIKLGLQEHVALPGAVSQADVLAALAQCHALVAPSVRDTDGDMDGIPNVILEAMASGRPVIGTKLSGIPEVVRPRETGLLVPPGQPEALAAAMDSLTEDSSLYRSMSSQARAHVEKRFALTSNTARQCELLAATVEELRDRC